LACALLNVDNLNAINSGYSRDAGDTVLGNLAMVLRNNFRRHELLGTYQGNMAVLLPDHDGDQAFEAVENIRESFAKIEHSDKGRAFTATFSAGIAYFPAHADAEALLLAARDALGQAKKQGNAAWWRRMARYANAHCLWNIRDNTASSGVIPFLRARFQGKIRKMGIRRASAENHGRRGAVA
jgi:diguanylate cyclase (GGDEF)-like protein